MVLVALLAVAGCHGTSKAPVPVTLDSSCEHDWDCTPAPQCCPTPCTSNVINARDLDRAWAALSCPSGEQCPVAGGCLTHAYLCVDRTCKLVLSNEPGFRERQVPPAP